MDTNISSWWTIWIQGQDNAQGPVPLPILNVNKQQIQDQLRIQQQQLSIMQQLYQQQQQQVRDQKPIPQDQIFLAQLLGVPLADQPLLLEQIRNQQIKQLYAQQNRNQQPIPQDQIFLAQLLSVPPADRPLLLEQIRQQQRNQQSEQILQLIYQNQQTATNPGILGTSPIAPSLVGFNDNFAGSVVIPDWKTYAAQAEQQLLLQQILLRQQLSITNPLFLWPTSVIYSRLTRFRMTNNRI